MVVVAGRPFIEWPLMQLRDAGFESVVLCTGYRGDVVRDHLGDGAALGLEISYSDDGPRPLGTLGALSAARHLLGEDVPVLYADTVLAVEFSSVVLAHSVSSAAVTMTVIKDLGRWNAANCVVDDGYVTAYAKDPPPPGAGWVDYGFLVLDRDVIPREQMPGAGDLAPLLGELATAGRVTAFPVAEPFREIGTPEALAETEAFLRRRAAAG